MRYPACAHFALRDAALSGITESGWEVAARGTVAGSWLPKDMREAETSPRTLTLVIKARRSLWSTLGLRVCVWKA